MAEQFHIGQQVRLTRTLATRPEGLFRRGATGTVMYMEEMVLIRMDQHFPSSTTWTTPRGLNTATSPLRREGSWRGSGPRCGNEWMRLQAEFRDLMFLT